MPTIEKQIDEVCELIDIAVGSCPHPAPFWATYQIPIAIQYKEILIAIKDLARTGRTTAIWILLRSLVDMYIQASWIGRSDDRTTWVVIAGEVSERNRVAEYLKDCERLKDNTELDVKPDPRIETTIKILDTRVADLQQHAVKKPEYWDEKKKAFKRLPSANKMAESSNYAFSFYNSYFKYGSWHVHADKKVLSSLIKGGLRKGRRIKFVAPCNEDLPQTLSSVMVLAIACPHLLSALGLNVDMERLNKLARDSNNVYRG